MNDLMINTNDLPISQNKILNSAPGEIISEYETICPEIRDLFDNTEKDSEDWITYVLGFIALLAENDS